MSPIVVGIAGIGILIFMFVLRMPIAFAMTIIGFVGFSYLTSVDAGLSLLSRELYTQFSKYSFSVIPMFILMGCFAFASGISTKLYHTAYVWIGHLRGGLAIATVAACAFFAAISGSATATAATMGRIALPEMKKYHYDDTMATGAVAAAGSLGILIPPSTVFIVYGLLTEQSVGKLFMAGVIPGIILSIFMIIAVWIICKRNPKLGPPGEATTWKEKFAALTGVIDTGILFVGTMGGLFAGFFTPTEAGAIGAAGALLIGIARRQLTFPKFFAASRDAVRTSCMVMFIIGGAIVFGKFLAVSTLTFELGRWVDGLQFSPVIIISIIIFIYFIGGFFMDALALVVLTIPIFFPIVMRLGFDPIWFGVIIVLVNNMGLVTPPVGNNVFVVRGVAPDVPLENIFKGVIPFLIAMII